MLSFEWWASGKGNGRIGFWLPDVQTANLTALIFGMCFKL